MLAALPVDNAQRDRVRTPAGLDIGAHSPPEVALSILAEIVATRDRPAPDAERPEPDVVATAVDPVCGMTVVASTASPHAETPDGVVYFCGSGCRSAYLDNPVAYTMES